MMDIPDEVDDVTDQNLSFRASALADYHKDYMDIDFNQDIRVVGIDKSLGSSVASKIPGSS